MSIAELTGIDVPTGLLIGGEWSKGNATFPVLDPATEEPLAEVADGTVADALDAVGAAQAALPGLGGDAAAAAGRDPAPRVRVDDRTRRGVRPADVGRERQSRCATPAARRPTRRSSSAGTPRRRCAWRALSLRAAVRC